MTNRICGFLPPFNEAKGVQTHAVDPLSQQIVPLFNPRMDKWSQHFQWTESSTQILGITAIAQATVSTLSLNADLRVRSRKLWVEAGYHPPLVQE
jgi:hypothetical protein